jgi:hypothetical protein
VIGPSIAVVIGTIGRPTLEDTLESIKAQGLRAGDQVIVVRDSFEDPDDMRLVQGRVERFGPQFQYAEYDAGYHYNGVEQTNHGLTLATADVVLSLGDDDIYVDGAFEQLRRAMAPDVLRPVLFRFLAPWRVLLWDQPRMKRSHISGQCMAIPRPWQVPQPTGRYPEVDFEWMEAMLAKADRPPLWFDELLVVARPRVEWSCP